MASAAKHNDRRQKTINTQVSAEASAGSMRIGHKKRDVTARIP